MHSKLLTYTFLSALLISTFGCGGGSGGGGAQGEGSGSANFGCDGNCANQSLSEQDVTSILQAGIAAADSLGVRATFSIVDRVGNVLALYKMPSAPEFSTFQGDVGSGAIGGFEGVQVPAALAAISKAGTGAYLSSQGNAFSTRTASQIIQEHFDPGERDQTGGPLFGVQFSQLLCSDVTTRFSPGNFTGPKALPLGLSADPGGFPLYKDGDLVGGIGVEFDGLYTLDRNIRDVVATQEEIVALTASQDFAAPSERVAGTIFVAGRSLIYSDISFSDLPVVQASGVFDPSGLVAFPGFSQAKIIPGTVFGTVASGVARTTRAGQSTMQLVTASGAERFPVRAGAPRPDGLQLTAAEVNALLDSALGTAQKARAAIRQPLDSQAQVSIWVVDVDGSPLGFTRTYDAPVFGIDVSLQKARTAALFSSPQARAALESAGMGRYLVRSDQFLGAGSLQGQLAFTARAVGNLSRPFFPDGIEGTMPGPYSLPFPAPGVDPSWSPFNTGLQLDLVFGAVNAALGALPTGGTVSSCSPTARYNNFFKNGIQIFPGAVALYRNGVVIGAFGVSGDGIDQDDMISFYSTSSVGLTAAGYTGMGDPELGFNAPKNIRSDQQTLLVDQTIRMRYVNCPESPFRGSNDQQVCDGL